MIFMKIIFSLFPPNQATTCRIWHPTDSAGHHLTDIFGFRDISGIISGILDMSGLFLDFPEYFLADIFKNHLAETVSPVSINLHSTQS